MAESDDVPGAQPDPSGTPPAGRPPRYGEPGYVSPYAPPAQGGYGSGRPLSGTKPESHMVGAILTTLFCCLPAGIVSIVYAAKVDSLYGAGDYNGALNASSNAKFWMWVSIVGGPLSGLILAVVLVKSGSGAFNY